MIMVTSGEVEREGNGVGKIYQRSFKFSNTVSNIKIEANLIK